MHLCLFIVSINFPNIHFNLVSIYTVYLLSYAPLLYFNVNYYGGQIFCEIDEDWCKLGAAAINGILLTFRYPTPLQ